MQLPISKSQSACEEILIAHYKPHTLIIPSVANNAMIHILPLLLTQLCCLQSPLYCGYALQIGYQLRIWTCKLAWLSCCSAMLSHSVPVTSSLCGRLAIYYTHCINSIGRYSSKGFPLGKYHDIILQPSLTNQAACTYAYKQPST